MNIIDRHRELTGDTSPAVTTELKAPDGTVLGYVTTVGKLDWKLDKEPTSDATSTPAPKP